MIRPWKFAPLMLLATLAVPAQADAPRNAYERAAVDAVQAHVNVYRKWDLDAFVETFAADATVMVDGKVANGHEAIRRFYSANFEGNPHTIQILESGVRKGLVYLTVSYTFEDGYERCCSYGEYFVKDGKVAYLNVTMSNRAKRVRRAETPEPSEAAEGAQEETRRDP